MTDSSSLQRVPTFSGWPLRFVALLALLSVFIPVAAGGSTLQVPNLVPLPPNEIWVGWADGVTEFTEDQPKAIRFTVSTANRGAYALELFSAPDAMTDLGINRSERPAEQCVWWVSRVCTHRQGVGNFIWHQEHVHWHFEDYALYELRRVKKGAPDMEPAGLVAPGYKASFCLVDFSSTGEEPPGHDPLAGTRVYVRCDQHLQGISPGWRDTYDGSLFGQQIPLEGIKDGTYALVVTVNPDLRLMEADYSDNVAYTVIDVSENGTVVRSL